MEKEIDRLCLEFLVRQQPVAGTLRFAYSAIKINLELERVGDYAESIARQMLKLIATRTIRLPTDRFPEMANLRSRCCTTPSRPSSSRTPTGAARPSRVEEAVDVLKSKLNTDLVELFRENDLRSRR